MQYKNFYKLMGNGKKKNKIEKRLYPIFIKALFFIGIIFLVEILFVLGFWIFGKTNEPNNILSTLGTFGDFFGGMLNPILTFCSFMALLMTIILQQKELSLTRKELSETQKATRDSATALEKQRELLDIQTFETTFFNMINLHNEIINNILFKYSKDSVHYGKKAISKLFNKYISSKTEDKNIMESYDNFYGEYNDIVGHYFRNLYQILKYIDEKCEEEDDPKFYTNILRAQLSSAELGLLLINAVSSYGYDKFLYLLIKFEFMEHLPFKTLNSSYKEGVINLCIQKSVEESYEKNKLFGENENWKKYVNEISTKPQGGTQNA